VAPPRGSSPCVFVQVRWRPYPLSLTSSLTGGDDLRITSPQRPTGCCGPGPRRAAVDARRCSPAWLLDWLLVRSSPVIASSQFARRVYLGRGRGSIKGFPVLQRSRLGGRSAWPAVSSATVSGPDRTLAAGVSGAMNALTRALAVCSLRSGSTPFPGARCAVRGGRR
jgi:hypothetical protein